VGKRAPVDLVADVRLGKCRPAWLAPKSPRFFKQSYEPLFFDARLPFSEEIEKGAGAALGIATTGVERAVAVVAGGERALICAAIISGCAMARPLFGHT
jgi:hypothetical protein